MLLRCLACLCSSNAVNLCAAPMPSRSLCCHANANHATFRFAISAHLIVPLCHIGASHRSASLFRYTAALNFALPPRYDSTLCHSTAVLIYAFALKRSDSQFRFLAELCKSVAFCRPSSLCCSAARRSVLNSAFAFMRKASLCHSISIRFHIEASHRSTDPHHCRAHYAIP